MISPEVLRRYPYFANVSDASLKAVAMISEETTAPAGEMLFREGEPSKCLYIVQQGEVNIQYVLAGGEHKTVDTLVSGDLMVLSALIEPHKTYSMGMTVKDVKLVAIDAAKLRELCGQDPVLGYQLMKEVTKALTSRLNGARVQLATLS